MRCRLIGLGEEKAVLRDAVLLTALGEDPGPNRRIFLALEWIATRKPSFSSKTMV